MLNDNITKHIRVTGQWVFRGMAVGHVKVKNKKNPMISNCMHRVSLYYYENQQKMM